MPNTSRTQMLLADSPHFQSRVKASLTTVASQVLNEDPSTEHHQARAAYANLVNTNLDIYARNVALVVSMRTNLLTPATTFDFEIGAVVTAATDAEIASQLATDWNMLAGVVEAA